MTASVQVSSKVIRPVFRGCLHRERLYRILEESAARPVAWVSGPAGSGKTTLVSGYIEHRRIHHIWYRVDEGDSDLATFFRCMELARGKRAGGGKSTLPREGVGSARASQFARRYFEGLYNRIRPPAFLVFDDWQNPPPRSSLEETVREAVSLLPEGVRAVFISREDPSSEFLRSVDRRRVEHLGWKDLRLTPEETGEIARTQRKDPSGETIRYLHSRTGGWATGVVLLLEHSQHNGIEPQRIGCKTPEEIVEYLGRTLFERLDAETRLFLVKTAFLPRMTAKGAEKLTGHPGAGKILSRLNRNNLFTELHPGDEPVYEYHSLFREFLHHRADEMLSPEEACATRHGAAALLEEAGHVEESVALMRWCADFRGLCRVIRKEARSLIGQGRGKTVGDWIAALPGELRESDPWLLYWSGVCALPGDPRAGRESIARAFARFSEAADPAGSLLSWSAAVDSILCEREDFTRLDPWIEWLERRAAQGITFPSAEVEARVSASISGALSWRKAQNPGIREWIGRALSASRAAEDDGIRLHALVHAAEFFQWSGDRAAASRAAEEIRFLGGLEEASPHCVVAGKWLEASERLGSDADPEGALRAVAEGIEICRRTGVRIWEPNLYGAGAYASLLKGDSVEAGRYLEKMKAAATSGGGIAAFLYEHLCGWHHMLRGDPVGARAHAEQALSHADAAGAVFPAILSRIALASISSARKDSGEAREHLARALPLAHASGSRILEFAARLEEARIALDHGDQKTGLAALREGFGMGRREGYINLFWWWEPSVMTRLCLAALEAGIEPEYVLGLVRKRGLFPEVPPMEIEEWPWKIRIYTLGRFGIVREGKKVVFEGKSQRRPLQLLKVLVALGGRDIPREKAADLLWPETDGDRALQALAVTVRRLRALLGDERAVIIADGRLTLSNRICWVDCWAFKRIFSKAEKALREGAGGASAAAQLEKALDLYRGEFLEDGKEETWTVPLRERLRTKFLRCVMDAARIRESAGEWERALSCYRKGLEADELHEEFYRRIMICHQRLCRRSEAVAAYQRCRRTLNAALGVTPSAETEALLESIRKSTDNSREPAG